MIGKTFSHYKILSKLGEGGMGEVWEAQDSRLDRVVAIKLIPKHLSADPNARMRFVHEAKAASSIEHANICTIHEIDETSEGETFIVMPRYMGEPLSDLIAREHLPLRETLHVIEDLAGAMAEAHDHDIIHRDVKPGNIIIDQNGRPVLLDFGLAKLSKHTQVTKTGTTLGTLAYMAPEQAAGCEVDGRADLFSLGVILYELVTGVRPFGGDHDAAVLYSIAHQPAPPLATHDTSLPHGIQTIIDRALAKDPKDRYPTMHDLQAAIRDLRHELQTDAGMIQGDQGPARSRPRWIAPVAAVLVIAVALAVWKFLPNQSRETEAVDHALAVLDFRDLTTPDDLQVSAGMTELVNIGLIENSPIRVVSPEYLQDLRRRLFGTDRGPIEDDQILEIAQKAGATLILAGRMGRIGEEQFVTWRLVDTRSGESVDAQKVEGRKLTVLVDRIVVGVLPVIARLCGTETASAHVAVDRITTESPEAYEHFIAGKLFGERNLGIQSRDELEKAIALDPTFALAHLELGRLFWNTLRDKDKAHTHLDRAESLKERLGGKDRLRLEAARHDDQRQFARSVATYEEILKRWPDDREVLGELMKLHWRYWNFRGVAGIAQQGLKFYPDDLHTFGSTYAVALRSLGRPQESLRLSRNYVDRNPDDPNAWDDLGWSMLALGYPDSAEVAFRKVLELDPSWVANNLGQCAYSAGDLDLAIARTEQFMDRADLPKSQQRFQARIYSIFMGLSALYRESGQYLKANQVIDEVPQVDRDIGWAFGKCNALLYTGQPQPALEIAEDMANRYDDARMRVYSIRIRARASVALGDFESARQANSELYAAQKELGMLAKTLALKNEAEIALAEKDPAKALEMLDKLYGQGLGRIGFMNIDCREAQAHAHRMAGQLAEAAAVHEELLRILGGHALSHYELGLIYEEMDRPQEAKQEFTKFLEMWSKADEGLPQLIHARQRLAALN